MMPPVWVQSQVVLVVAFLLAGCMANDSVEPPEDQLAPPEQAPAPSTSEDADEVPQPAKAHREGVVEITVLETHPDNVPPADHEQHGFSSFSNGHAVRNLLQMRLMDGDVPVNATWDLGDGTRIEAADVVEHRFIHEGWYWINASGQEVQAREPVLIMRYTYLSGSLPPCPTCEAAGTIDAPHPNPPARYELHISNATRSIGIDVFANLAEPWFILYDENGNERARPDPLVGMTTFWAHAWSTDVEPGGARVWYLDVWNRAGVPDASFGAMIEFG